MSERGPRRQVLDRIAAPVQRLKWLKDQWTVTGTVWLTEDEREPGGARRRPRRPEEYPENDANQWAALRQQAHAAAVELEQLRAYADARYNELAAVEAQETR